MKTTLTIAALFLVSSAAAFAEQATPTGPVQMTAAEMDQVVAGAGQQQLKDGTGDGIPDRVRDPSVCGN